MDGTEIEGKLDANGKARHENVPAGVASLYIGEDERDWSAFDEDDNTNNPFQNMSQKKTGKDT